MLKKLCQYSGCNEMAEPGHTYCAKHLAESQKKHEEWLQNHNKKKKPFENAVRSNNYNNAEWRLEVSEVIIVPSESSMAAAGTLFLLPPTIKPSSCPRSAL